MKRSFVVILFSWVFNFSQCLSQAPEPFVQKIGTTVESRYLLPKGFVRNYHDPSSFAGYLRRLPLKEHGSKVKYFFGGYKFNDEAYCGVVDLPIGNKNLHQCADAVIRLRAEYLWSMKKFDQIHFNFTNGFNVEYTRWMQGYRIAFRQGKAVWVKIAEAGNSEKILWGYLEQVFMYAGTLSLSKELKRKKIDEIEIGDVFIRGGSPGHAVIVVDMAENPSSHQKIFMLAQSYMPAQEIQILKNPNKIEMGPWYELKEIRGQLVTPEWVFNSEDLKCF